MLLKLSQIAIAFSLSLLPIAVPSTTFGEVQLGANLVAQSLQPLDISLRAKQFTVSIEGAGSGTGVIVAEVGDSYQVLTDWRVVQQPGKYRIRTIDGRSHVIDYSEVQRLPSLNLALLHFSSKRNYQLAELGNSASLNEGATIYVAGYTGGDRGEESRYYSFSSAILASILPNPTPEGYSLAFEGGGFSDLNGSPIINERGLLIGIQGTIPKTTRAQESTRYAIPINRYQNAIAKLDTQEQDRPRLVAKDAVSKPKASHTKPKAQGLSSTATGINYTRLKRILGSSKWQEADLLTQQLITRIVRSAKLHHQNRTTTINELADYVCTDIAIIDRLWQQYSGNRFGFTPQQDIWLTTVKKHGFSTNTWRRFAIALGWKEGSIDNDRDYLLYEWLNFEPASATKGHLPWWFANSSEEQDIIKTVFNRCSLSEH